MEIVNENDEHRYFTDWYAISMTRVLVIGTGLVNGNSKLGVGNDIGDISRV
jgi:hypothetical protein